MSRYLEVQAQGLLEWLGRPPTSPAQKVFSGLLRLPHSVALIPARLADQFGLELPDLSRALFELNRRQSLLVTDRACDHAGDFRYEFDLICEDLRSLAPGSPELMLAGTDGLCLAQQGLSEDTCLHQAARCHDGADAGFALVAPLHLGATVLHLCSRTRIDADSPALLRLVRRLVSLPLHA
ncbi:hypothetical protein [Curvibacter sp. PAE-UM]|uniref:hypothetical protein n=1 Tax=Curvibacter sp. PAE-UM TaxID=1714344 RepID=UPI00070B4D09|nr:hypothetical protein [Curvibacter sp. PAE-UM]KRI01028.1 hypothetical protein AO057_10500 [Curvibacter sp. PAE-UM]